MQRVERELVFVRPDVVIVYDRVDLGAGGEAVWQLNTPIQPMVAGSFATLDGASGSLNVTRIGGAATSYDVTDWTIDPDMNGGWRLDLRDGPRFLHVLFRGTALTDVIQNDAGTRDGVELQLAAGGTVRVHFERDAIGGDLEITDAGGNVIVSGELPTGVETLPVLR